MSNVINKTIVLKLNSHWIAVGLSTVGKAIVDLAGGNCARALNFEYEVDENGEYIVDENGSPVNDPISAEPLDWENWLKLKVRPWEKDDAIHYGGGSKIMRCPTVLIAKNYSKMPMKSFRGRPSKEALWHRDNGTDQYTGKKLKKEEATIDHIIPKSKGGRDEWENLVYTSKEINSKKGNKLNHEVGLKLIKKPVIPKPVPVSQLINHIAREEWKKFLPHLMKEK